MLNIAIIGVGNISRLHIEAIQLFKDKANIVALVDITPEVAHKKNTDYNLGAQVFESHQALLDSGLTIDLVHICTPPYTHAPIAIDCMDAGMNVLVEKPMATCLKECDDMLAAEKRNGVTLGVIAQNRFRDSVFRLKKITDSGIAGKIRAAHVNSFWWRGRVYYDLWWRGTWEKEGGGPTLNHAVHHIDMLNWLQGEMPQEVTSVLTNVMHDNSEVEDLSFATLKYADNAVASITSSVIHHGEEQGIELQFEHAKVASPFAVRANHAKGNGFPEENQPLVDQITAFHDETPALHHEGHPGQIEDMLDALTHNRPPAITGQDGKNTIELITAIYKAGFLKRTITLPITQEDDYYTFEGILNNAPRFYEKQESKDMLSEEAITVGTYLKGSKRA